MKKSGSILQLLPLAVLAIGLLILTAGKQAGAASFESGSTCGTAFFNSTTCRGAFSPTVNTTVQLPPNGILDYTTVYIPSNVTVSYVKNAANTPVIIRTSGNVTIEGVISVSAQTAPTSSGTYGDGNLGDDAQPGTGGPGGFDGGYGGLSALFGGSAWRPGGAGKGPGGGQASVNYNSSYPIGGGGGSFGSAGGTAWNGYGAGGATYGQSTLLPLIGGSGGGVGLSGGTYSGAGGGGGGGAILIAAGTAAAPATITVSKNGTYGYIYADGYGGGSSAGSGCGGEGGGGSGGAIRLVANTLSCPGGYCRMYARGGGGGGSCWNGGGAGGAGIIRLEANIITGWTTSMTNPAYSFGLPGHVQVPNNPTLFITSVTPTNGTASGTAVSAPANPTGNADITFPTGTSTATVNLAATSIPAGATATVYVIPANGAPRTQALSNAFSSADVNGVSTTTATVTLSPGNNVLQAAVTYTVTELVAMNLPTFDNGERVAKIRVEGGMDGKSQVTYITASGKEYPAVKVKA